MEHWLGGARRPGRAEDGPSPRLRMGFALVPERVATNTRLSIQTAALAVLPQQREAEHQAARTAIIREAALPDEIAAELTTGQWHAEPIDISLLWAYEVEWSPTPVFQSFSAYTTPLDNRNAEAVSNQRPRILERINHSIDGRWSLWESPRYRLSLFCEYETTHASEKWQVLAPTNDRCGAPVAVGESMTSAGVSTPVPELPDATDLLLLRVEVDDSLAARLVRSLWKDYDPVLVTIDGREYRLPRGHLGEPLILCARAGSGVPPPVPDACPLSVSVSHKGKVTFEALERLAAG